MRRTAWLLLLSLAGCTAAGSLSDPPSVQLADIRFAEPGLLEQTIGLDLRFTNPNPEPIRADGLRFTLDLEGSAFGTGVSDGDFVIPRLGEAIVPVTIRVQTGALIERLLAFDGGTIDYRIEGDLFQSPGLGGRAGRRLGFASESAIAIPDFQRLLDRLRPAGEPAG